ncbi:MAG: hypothetical protein GTO63_24430 [Anaerolineae bacterium]|nr:hypothetical protein [Anaerolineae bacterium]NIN97870.1 hypothetical protein [Anaerolineae bacterium]NIQ80849.1 hypothetical protein [Anaerolineae bacterium]
MTGERDRPRHPDYIPPRAHWDRADLSSDFWLEDEHPEEIIVHDEATMARLGIEPQELARKMAWAVELSRQKEHYCKTFTYDRFTVSSAYYRMSVSCPLCGGESGNGELLIIDDVAAEELFFPSLMPHLVSAHHFFESPASVYGVEPEAADRVLRHFPAPDAFLYTPKVPE